jgi:hypothetical protein
LETQQPLPLGAEVSLSFLNSGETAEIVARGQVKNHYFVNYVQSGNVRSVVGMAIRFLSFEDAGQYVLHSSLNRARVLH